MCEAFAHTPLILESSSGVIGNYGVEVRFDLASFNAVQDLFQVSQEKLPAIAGSVATENNIRHYIKTMAPRISAIVQAQISTDKCGGTLHGLPQYKNTPATI